MKILIPKDTGIQIFCDIQFRTIKVASLNLEIMIEWG